MTYVDGYVAAVPAANKAAYVALAQKSWEVFRQHGALSMKECWGDEVPEGEVTSFPMAVKLQPGEVVVFAWVVWPDKATRQACWDAAETDPEFMAMGDMTGAPFDGRRMIYGGFAAVVENDG